MHVSGKVDGAFYVLGFSILEFEILPDEYDRIFVPGYKGKLTYEEHRSGSGMGLAIVKEIADKHSGKIEVKSTKTDGEAYLNSFFVQLP